jgi:hypothetical protein
MTVFGYMMAVVYIGLGISLFFPTVFSGIPKNLKFVFSLFFISYGIFRLVKIHPKKDEIATIDSNTNQNENNP